MRTQRKTLKDFIRLAFAFFFCLVVLSVYQYFRLYLSGVLDGFVNKSLLLLLVHQLGFTSVTSLILVFLFNLLENKKPSFGFKFSGVVLVSLLVLETLLIEYYVTHYEILGLEIFHLSSAGHLTTIFLIVLLASAILGSLFYFFNRVSASLYNAISKMYPFTILLFGLFLATLTSNKKPINENKTQHLMTSIIQDALDFNPYEGDKEYPLLTTYAQNDVLGPYMQLKAEKPNLVFLIVTGLGADFVGDRAIYKGFTPFLDSLATQSLYWTNYLSNSGERDAALPSIFGSLPFGKDGFTYADNSIRRNTLFAILKNNGYVSAFNYGGNSALGHLDKFLDEERVDYLLDKKSFGADYQMQEEDAAGFSLGYPDKELFRKWYSDPVQDKKPRLEVFLTLSTKRPFLVPDRGALEDRVSRIVATSKMRDRSKRLVGKNKEIFASLLYADQALKGFFDSFRDRPEFGNTIFIITGSHNSTDLPHRTDLDRYKVPLFIYSPLVKSPTKINTLASHADVLPSLIALLDKNYEMKFPLETSWLGKDLIATSVFDSTKTIPLFRNKKNIRDFIQGEYLVSGSSVYQMDEHLGLREIDEEESIVQLKQDFKRFKAINKYVIAENKLIPPALDMFKRVDANFAKDQIIWINSVFNGDDFDNAYDTARSLAFDGDKERALLLCRYILTKIPGHADTEILMGRINAWQGKYETAVQILREAIRKYPTYSDGYAALLDVYFWSDRDNEALALYKLIVRNGIEDKDIKKKLSRAYLKLKSNTPENTTNFYSDSKLEAYLTSTTYQ